MLLIANPLRSIIQGVYVLIVLASVSSMGALLDQHVTSSSVYGM